MVIKDAKGSTTIPTTIPRMHWLFWLALRELWAYRWRSLLALLALALSVGLVVATGSIGALMQASMATVAPLTEPPSDSSTRTSAGSDFGEFSRAVEPPGEVLWISSAYDADYDLPASLETQVGRVPGVAETQPVLRRPVHVQTPRADTLTLMGVMPAAYFAFHDLTLAAGALPSAETPGLVALAPWAFVRDLALGEWVTVTTPSGDVGLPITGLVEVKDLTAAQHGLVLYAPLDTVAEMFELQGTITTLEMRTAPGASPRRVQAGVEKALGPAYAVSVASRPGQANQLWQRLVIGALVFVDGLTLAGSVGLVYAVFGSAARARRQQIGLLRAVGAVRGQVLALMVTEAILLGAAGSGVGLVAGVVFARIGADLVLQGTKIPVVPLVPVGTLLLAVATGVLSSLAGAIGPAIRAARRPPLAALQTPPLPQVQLLRQISAGRRQRTRLRPPPTPTPASFGRKMRTRDQAIVARLCSTLFPIEGRLAAVNLARERGRAGLIAGTLALILGMVLGNVGVLSLLGEELVTTFGRLTGGDYLVLPGLTTISLRELAGQDTSDAPPLSPGLLVALEALDDQVWLMGGTTADIEPLQVFPGQPTLLLDIEGYARMGGFHFQAGNWPSALESFKRGPAVLLTPVVARRLNVGLGDRLRLDTPNGPVDFSVAGIGDSEFTTCVLDLSDGAAYFGVNEINGVEVQVRPGANADVVQWALLDAVRTHGGTLVPMGQATAQLREIFHQAMLSIGLLIGVTGLVAGLGVVNAMLASVTERQREIGMLRAVGATRAQINRLILTEAATLGTRAALIGTALGWAITLLFLGTAQATLGLGEGAMASPAAWLPLLVASVAGLGLWPLLAMLGGLGPARHAARLPVIQALYESTPG